MLDPWQLRTFLAAADGLSFRQAAKDLSLAPSTVTAQIKALEDALGVSLFRRSPGQVVLTEHGRRLLGPARRLLDLEAAIRRDVGQDGDAWPELSLRLSESLGLAVAPVALAAARRDFPGLRVSMATHSRRGLAHDLRQAVVDLGLFLGEPFAADGLVMEEIHREPLCVIAAPGSPLAGREAAWPEDFAGRELFVTRHLWSARRGFENALARHGVCPGAVTTCTSLPVVARCVASGDGLALAPWLAVAGKRAAGSLAVLPWAEEPLFAPVLAVYRAGKPLSRPAAAFLEAVRQALASLPPAPAAPHQEAR
ncbi:MAG: LysR family transcriptional regulator [Solidesulfovibrio sp. DCME]|uniref:LysR family transcriptional regulator n=1 Tax=Solidesulfovibrio sp. DCME TaxID=3447380 RepID=UPI003D09BEA7